MAIDGPPLIQIPRGTENSRTDLAGTKAEHRRGYGSAGLYRI